MAAARWFWLVTTVIFGLALLAYAWQASGTKLLSRAQGDRDRYLAEVVLENTADHRALQARARDYWQRNPDVAGDAYYGNDGPLGVLGARQHYEDHGRREGRQWVQ